MISLSGSDQVSKGETSPKLIESTGYKVKDSTTGVGNMLDILGGIGGTSQWCVIVLIILVLVYVNRSALLKLCQRKTSKSADQTATPLNNPLTSTATSPSTFAPRIGGVRQS